MERCAESESTVAPDLVLATANPHKREELVALLGDLGFRIRTLEEFPSAPSIVEDGETCQANAIKKAEGIARHTGLLTLADDTGLEVEALGGRPGVYAARYAGEEATYVDNCRKLLHELKGVPASQRTARFVTVVAIVDPSAGVEVVEGVLEGRVAEAQSGTQGFGYDPVFFVPELNQTLAELTLEQKNQMSHHARALIKAKEVLRRKLKEHNTDGA